MPDGLEGRKISMTQLANALSGIVGPPVIDKTGYTGGGFDFHLEFDRELTATGPTFSRRVETTDWGQAAIPRDLPFSLRFRNNSG